MGCHCLAAPDLGGGPCVVTFDDPVSKIQIILLFHSAESQLGALAPCSLLEAAQRRRVWQPAVYISLGS